MRYKYNKFRDLKIHLFSNEISMDWKIREQYIIQFLLFFNDHYPCMEDTFLKTRPEYFYNLISEIFKFMVLNRSFSTNSQTSYHIEEIEFQKNYCKVLLWGNCCFKKIRFPTSTDILIAPDGRFKQFDQSSTNIQEMLTYLQTNCQRSQDQKWSKI